MTPKKIGFIGLGLIGGSITKRLKHLYPELTVIATAGHLETIEQAHELGLIENDTLLSPPDFSDCDYIFLCAPVRKNIEYLRLLKDAAPEHCIITDVGSVKSDIHKAVISLDMEDRFIGGHPMAGSEKTGILNANEYLLENAYYIITPTAKTTPQMIADFRELVLALGAVPMVLDYEAHDTATAAISHLPHVIAYSLVNLVRKSDDENETMKTIAAGGFKDITRIASSSPVMWENICRSNREPLLRLLDAYVRELSIARTAIEKSDSETLLSLFSGAKDYRDSLGISHRGILKPIYELYLDLPDEAGSIATVATILAGNHLNIKNIGIIHNREFEDGVLHLELYDEASLLAAVGLLKKRGYTIYEH